MKGYRVAVVGATGLMGQEFVRILAQRHFPMSSIHLLASDRSLGRKLRVNHEDIAVTPAEVNSFDDIDIAFFCAGADVSRYLAPPAVRAGAIVIDSGRNFRMTPEVPLVVPEINIEDARKHRGIIASPGGSAIQLAMVLHPLHKVNQVRRASVATYQSVSGTGAAAMEELTVQTRQVLDGQTTVAHAYPHQIAFNVLPEVDVFLDNGYSKEEWRIYEETRKVMHSDLLSVSATCVRVPVLVGDSMAVHLELNQAMPTEDAIRILSEAPGIKVLDESSVSLYPQPWSVAGSDDVFIGRVRRDISNPSGLALWSTVDNLRKGGALNAVQIAEEIIKRGWLHPGSLQ